LAIGVSPDGSKVFVTGTSQAPGSLYGDYATVAYDATSGSQLWVQRFSGRRKISNDVASALGVSPDGTKLFVTGWLYYGSAHNYDYTTIAYDTAAGTQLWLAHYDGPANYIDQARALGVSPDGAKVFVTGRSTTIFPGQQDYATVGYDASTGSRLWVKRYDGTGNGPDDAYALGVSPDGSSVFVTGQSPGSTSGFDYATVAYSTG